MNGIEFEISRLDLRPGDIIVLRFQERLSREAVEGLRQTMKSVVGDHRCLVLEKGAEISVLTAAQLEERLVEPSASAAA